MLVSTAFLQMSVEARADGFTPSVKACHHQTLTIMNLILMIPKKGTDHAPEKLTEDDSKNDDVILGDILITYCNMIVSWIVILMTLFLQTQQDERKTTLYDNENASGKLQPAHTLVGRQSPRPSYKL